MKIILCPNCGKENVYSVLIETNAYLVESYDEEWGYEELDFDDKIEFEEIQNNGYYCADCGHRFYMIDDTREI